MHGYLHQLERDKFLLGQELVQKGDLAGGLDAHRRRMARDVAAPFDRLVVKGEGVLRVREELLTGRPRAFRSLAARLHQCQRPIEEGCDGPLARREWCLLFLVRHMIYSDDAEYEGGANGAAFAAVRRSRATYAGAVAHGVQPFDGLSSHMHDLCVSV